MIFTYTFASLFKISLNKNMNLKKMKRTLNILAVFLILTTLSGCGDDDTVTPPIAIDEPTTYVFSRDDVSTVSFTGQTTRIAMAEEIVAAMENSTLTANSLKAMFNHNEGDIDFSNAELNASGKNVRSKVAASNNFFAANTTRANEIKADFDTWISSQANDVFPNWGTGAVKGVAGGIQEAEGGFRYVNANGLAYNQVVAKSLIGGLIGDQILNNYLSATVLDAGSNRSNQEAGIAEDGENFSTMEHNWDEAYGYVYGTSQDEASPNATIGSDDSFLNKYIGSVDGDTDFSGIADDIFNAFKLGRAAIVAGDYIVRDAQAAILRQKIAEIIAIRAVYYLQQGKTGLEAAAPDMASVFHDLSKGFGFVYSLQFTQDPLTSAPFFTGSEVEGFINTIYPTASGANGFWEVTPANLQTVSEAIAAEFDFTVSEAGS